MKISTIYDQGSAPYREDGLIVVGSCVFGVFDGTSAPYAPKYPLRMFDGMSGGEMVARTCERFTLIHTTPQDLQGLVLDINKVVGKAQRDAGIPLDDAGELAGATFAFARIDEETLSIAQAGDCLAIVKLKDGTILVTPDQVERHDRKMRAAIERLLREVAQELFGLTLEEIPEEQLDAVRREMWNRFYHPLHDARRRNANNFTGSERYGILNGQNNLVHFLNKWTFPRKDVNIVLLLTDGMIPKSAEDAHSQDVASTLPAKFESGGLAGLLLAVRAAEKKGAARTHIAQAEATGIALVF